MAEKRLKEILAFVNHKGGVGKTTTTQSLATGLRRYGKGYFGKDANGKERRPRILLIDLDPQVSLSFLFGWDQVRNAEQPTVFDAMVQQSQLPVYRMQEGIYLTPASQKLVCIEPYLNSMPMPRLVLKELLRKPVREMQGTELTSEGIETVSEAFDYVLVDCPPAMSLLTHNALATASSVIIPVQLELLATKGVAEITNAVKETRQYFNPALDVRGLLMVMSNDQTKATKQFKGDLEKKFQDYMFTSYTRRDTKMVEAQAMGTDIFSYAPYSRVGGDYERFTKEILASMPK